MRSLEDTVWGRLTKFLIIAVIVALVLISEGFLIISYMERDYPEIDLSKSYVECADGKKYSYDYMIVFAAYNDDGGLVWGTQNERTARLFCKGQDYTNHPVSVDEPFVRQRVLLGLIIPVLAFALHKGAMAVLRYIVLGNRRTVK